VESIKLFLTQYTDETIKISISVLVLVFIINLLYWRYNRKKFRKLTHQIPATVVKNYLDSIIANSNALKSSLFRGGGLDVGEGIPSVLPTGDLPTGGAGVSSEELAQKNAEIASLRGQIADKDKTIAELEKLLAAARESNGGGISDAEAKALNDQIADLKAQLEAAKAAGGGGGDPEAAAKLDQITKERDELKERLMEYEIIEEDLANLKKFQQENAQLKKTIEELKAGGAAPAGASADSEPAAPAAPAEPPPAAETQAAADEMPDVPPNEGEQKSAEELLSEFEKMLG
jgi:hypothetical protein